RAKPLNVEQAAGKLAEEAGRDKGAAKEALKRLLLPASTPERDRVGPHGSPQPFFAFRLHQFISGAGIVYTTLDAPGERPVELDAQQFLPGDEAKRLYATYFCRDCGQEYHPVRLRKDSDGQILRQRDIDDMP